MATKTEAQHPGEFLVWEINQAYTRETGTLAAPLTDGQLLQLDGDDLVAKDAAMSGGNFVTPVEGVLIGAGPTYLKRGPALVKFDLLTFPAGDAARDQAIEDLLAMGITVLEAPEPVSEPISEPLSEPASEPPSEPGFATFTVNSIDLSGGTLFGYHESIGGSVTGDITPFTEFNWFYSNPATTINIKGEGPTLPALEGMKLVRDGVGEMPLQGHTTFAGGAALSITLANLSAGLGITAAGAIDFHFEPFDRTGPLEISGHTNGNSVEWQSGSTNINDVKQGVEYDADHPILFLRVNAIDGGGSADCQIYGDTLTLFAGKKVTINGQDYAFDDATADYDVTFTGRTYYEWSATGSAALTPGTLYTVTISDV